MSLGSQITYKQLFKQHGLVRIPIIQRDYAQGREEETDIRDEFLSSLKTALLRQHNDPALPLNLDFIYGSVEVNHDETRFLPLDGQQRLTTLFLLHWYLAWRDDQWEEFEQFSRTDSGSRFTYGVRPSSNEFFDELVRFRPTDSSENILELASYISDQPWYFRSWRLDPTIQSVLGMLEAIHDRFSSSKGLFARLIDQDKPAITFQLLDLNNFGLSDDLYIKMNARGKPLTQFENFKARYEHELEDQFEGITFKIGEQNFSASNYVALRMDTAWTDLFWRLRDEKSQQFDSALMNMFRVVALVSRDPDHADYLNDYSLLRNSLKPSSYSDFHTRGWLDESFTLTIISLFDAWSKEQGSLSTLLPDNRFFDERYIFNKIANQESLSNEELVQFTAYAGFVVKHHNEIDSEVFQQWMRVVHNLSINTEYNRPDDIRRSIVGVNRMLEYSEAILSHLAGSEITITGFNVPQIAEERLKAELIMSDTLWKELIDQAESHGYFRGQIEFLLDFSGVVSTREQSSPNSWEQGRQRTLQDSFSNYLKLAKEMFGSLGLKSKGQYLWQRALLSLGDYLLPSGRNYSFLVNSATDQASWKRLLRGASGAEEARPLLQQLWNQLVLDQPIEDQLKNIIEDSHDLEPWRKALVMTPHAMEYCKGQLIRWNSGSEIYLLRKTQMNGAHAELFTFCLYEDVLIPLAKSGQLNPLKLEPYCEETGTELEPRIQLSYEHKNEAVYFDLEFRENVYKLHVHNGWLEKCPEVSPLLEEFGFSLRSIGARKSISPNDVEVELVKLAQHLLEFP